MAHATHTDWSLSKVLKYVLDEWPGKVDESLKAFYTRRCELSVERGCILRGTRVVIPEKLRKAVLTELHMGHPGIVKMKALARNYIWWPKIDADIEQMCKACEPCQLEQRMACQVPLHPWEFPGQSWKRLHLDFAGPFLGHTFMIVVDAYSKWLEVFKMGSVTPQATITRLRRLFAVYGLPEHIVTDNGTQFTVEFKKFMQQNGILHSTTAPGHPATNCFAEHGDQLRFRVTGDGLDLDRNDATTGVGVPDQPDTGQTDVSTSTGSAQSDTAESTRVRKPPKRFDP